MKYLADVQNLLARGIAASDVERHLREMGVPQADITALLERAGASVPAPSAPVAMLASVHETFVENAAAMLRDGGTAAEVAQAAHSLGLDAAQAESIVERARARIAPPPSVATANTSNSNRRHEDTAEPAELPLVFYWDRVAHSNTIATVALVCCVLGVITILSAVFTAWKITSIIVGVLAFIAGCTIWPQLHTIRKGPRSEILFCPALVKTAFPVPINIDWPTQLRLRRQLLRGGHKTNDLEIIGANGRLFVKIADQEFDEAALRNWCARNKVELITP